MQNYKCFWINQCVTAKFLRYQFNYQNETAKIQSSAIIKFRRCMKVNSMSDSEVSDMRPFVDIQWKPNFSDIQNIPEATDVLFRTTILPPTSSKPTQEVLNSFYFYKYEQFTVLWVLFTMIVLGNSAVLVTLIVSKSRKSRMNFFIRQLAIADLSVGLINVSTDIIWRITISWYAGNFMCKFIRFLQAAVTYSSTYVLVALSIDRYDAITHPMNFSGSWKRARILVVIAWFLSALFALPTIFLFGEESVEGLPQCWIDLKPWQWRVYMTLVSLALFFIPAIIITGCYTVIVWTIWSKSKLLTPLGHMPIRQSDECRNSTSPRHSSEDIDTRRASSRGIIPRAKIKTVKMTFVIVFVFVMCWSPYIVFDLLQVYDYIPLTQTNIAIATLIQSLAPLNSAANPVIYCLFSTHMCRHLRKLPPCTWISSCMSMCFPGMQGSGHCLGYGNGESSTTVTTSFTHSSRRSGSAASIRHNMRYGVQPALNNSNKVAISVV